MFSCVFVMRNGSSFRIAVFHQIEIAYVVVLRHVYDHHDSYSYCDCYCFVHLYGQCSYDVLYSLASFLTTSSVPFVSDHHEKSTYK